MLLAHATCRPSPDMRKHINMLQRRARGSSKLTSVRRLRLRDQLRDVIDSLAALGKDVGALPLPPPLARCRKKPQRLGEPDSMLLGWSPRGGHGVSGTASCTSGEAREKGVPQ